MTQQFQTNDITTRLLAQENLLIQRAPVSTASFDVVNRVLTLPQWQNMTPEIEEMLKAHEVAHALYTDYSIFEKAKQNEERKGIPHGFCNVLEDARIEKLMKRKYPGLRTVFNKGYKQLNERDFFELSKHDVNKLQLIDKINLYYKAGFDCGVKFTPAEKYLVDQVARLESIDDVVTLARKVFDYTKKQKQDLLKQLSNDEDFKRMMQERQQEQEEDEQLDFDNEDFGDNYDTMDDETNRHEYEGVEEEKKDEERNDRDDYTGRGAGTDADNVRNDDTPLDPITMRSFEEKLAESADVNTRYTYIDMVRLGSFENDIIIPYKKVLVDNQNSIETTIQKAVESGYQHRVDMLSHYSKDLNGDFDTFMVETQRVVAYLVKEFEMRKAATDYKRVQIAKSGVLDTRKLAQFKIREDLFKSIAITKDGKKHGMLFILDWSGSMYDYINDTVKQLISLVLFCHRVKIPFQVFAFTDDSAVRNAGMTDEEVYLRRIRHQNEVSKQAEHTLGLETNFNLIEFFSHKMTNTDLQKMCRTLFSMSRGFCADGYGLSGTPLNEALGFLYDYSEKFVRVNQIEKFTLIKLTDGDGGRVNHYNKVVDSTATEMEQRYGSRTVSMHGSYDWDGNKKIRLVRFLRCPVTKKVYSIDNNTQWGNMLTQLIKDRYDCGTIGFHVTDKRARDINYAMATYDLSTNDQIVYDARRDMIKEGFTGLKVFGHDELFLLKADHKVAEEELNEDMTKMTAAAIAKQFTKHLSAKKTSRILLNRFVGVVA
jgi:hypothetical protein